MFAGRKNKVNPGTGLSRCKSHRGQSILSLFPLQLAILTRKIVHDFFITLFSKLKYDCRFSSKYLTFSIFSDAAVYKLIFHFLYCIFGLGFIIFKVIQNNKFFQIIFHCLNPVTFTWLVCLGHEELVQHFRCFPIHQIMKIFNPSCFPEMGRIPSVRRKASFGVETGTRRILLSKHMSRFSNSVISPSLRGCS